MRSIKRTLSEIIAATTFAYSTLIGPVHAQPNCEFDLNEAISIVQADPTPVSQIDYSEIIRAAVDARIAHGNPYAGINPWLPETEVISLSNGSNMTMRYVSGTTNDNVWGDNEQIVYLLGTTLMQDLTVMPGTKLIFAGLQDNQNGGAMTNGMIQHLDFLYRQTGDVQATLDQLSAPEYSNRRSSLHVAGTLLVAGDAENPVWIGGDFGTSYDFSGISFANGQIDRAILQDFDSLNSGNWNTLVSRSVIGNNIQPSISGGAYIMGNNFLDSDNASIMTANTGDVSAHIYFNMFNNATGLASIIVQNTGITTIANNRFENGAIIVSEDYFVRDLTISGNDLLQSNGGRDLVMINDSAYTVDAPNNFWGTSNRSEIENIIYDFNDDRSRGIVTYNPIATSQDSDLDGLRDDAERTIGTNLYTRDTDMDGIIDGAEANTYGTNPLKADSDDDGLGDYAELFQYGTTPTNPDSDGDGLNDGDELSYAANPLNPDSDDDGLNDGDEVFKYKTNPRNPDSDGDTVLDGREVELGMNPLSADTDGDGIPDGTDLDPTICDFALDAPKNLKATDGQFDGGVMVTFEPALIHGVDPRYYQGATAPYQNVEYRVWRSESNDINSAKPLSDWFNGITAYVDNTARANVQQVVLGCNPGAGIDQPKTFFYWAEARNGCGESGFSNADAGYCAPLHVEKKNASTVPTNLGDIVMLGLGLAGLSASSLNYRRKQD